MKIIFSSTNFMFSCFGFLLFHIEYEDVSGVLDIWMEYKCKSFL